MGAITAYHKDIRHLNKDKTHVKLSFDHDDNCRIFIL